MRVTCGYHHPIHGFLATEFIESGQVDHWLRCSDLDLQASERFLLHGYEVHRADLTPVVTYDPELRRILGSRP